MDGPHLSFDQFHIDVARHSTDDFNPFHDPRRWRDVRGNPFGSPIAPPFQVAFLAAHRVSKLRRSEASDAATDDASRFSNYEFHFAGALEADEPFSVEVRKTVRRADGGSANRVTVRGSGGMPVLIGRCSDSATARFLADQMPSGIPSLEHLPDRIHIPGTPYFVKRKFLNTSNGKNFVLGALCDPYAYFDELSERVDFPPLFTASLMASALLEKGWAEHHDFAAEPLVHTSHRISVDRQLQRALRSNDCLHILIEGPFAVAGGQGLRHTAVARQQYRCFGLVHGRQVLFRALLQLAPLHAGVQSA